MTAYQILNIPETASQGEIKKAYRRLAMTLHPDRNGGDELKTQKFHEVQRAYDSLMSGSTKSSYHSTESTSGSSSYMTYDEFRARYNVEEVEEECMIVGSRLDEWRSFAKTLRPMTLNEWTHMLHLKAREIVLRDVLDQMNRHRREWRENFERKRRERERAHEARMDKLSDIESFSKILLIVFWVVIAVVVFAAITLGL